MAAVGSLSTCWRAGCTGQKEAGGERIGSSDFNGQDDSHIPLGSRHPIGGPGLNPMTAHLFWYGANGRVYLQAFSR